jgi:Uma2 family endonuclease
MATETLDFLPRLILTKPVRKYTLEQYLEKEAKSIDKHEFINGQIIKMPYAKGPHNIISVNMMTEMAISFRSLEKKYIVFPSDQKIYFPSLDEGVYADALAVCEKPLYWDDNQLLLINPIIIVEVLSKSTARYDRNGKFDKYKTLESIREYVLIRQDECYAEVWYRESPGRWQETIITNITEKIPLQSVGISISMEWVYHNVEFRN